MYENIRMKEVIEKLDPETTTLLYQNYPNMNPYSNMAREVIRKLDVKTLSRLYRQGLTINCTSITILATEALIKYDANHKYSGFYDSDSIDIIKDVIIKDLQNAFDKRILIQGSTLVNVLGFTLLDKCREHDYLLAKYGYELSRGIIFMGPEDWIKESTKGSCSIPRIIQKTPWAKDLLAS